MEAREYERMFALEDGHWWFHSKRALVRALLRRYALRPGRVLDLGCGTGGTLAAMGGDGCWVGLDREWLALAFSGKRGVGRLVQGSATALPFRTGSFDCCLALDLLYHRGVEDERAALAECHRVLRPGGLLLVTDSALAWLRSPHDDAVHARTRYSRAAMVRLVQAAGFQVLRASYAYTLLFPLLAGFRLLRRLAPGRGASGLFPLPAAVNRGFLAIQALERGLLRWIDLPIGTSVVCCARR